MNAGDYRETARMVMQRHGSRAQAVVLERANEAQVQGDTEAAYKWQQVHAVICDMRTTEPHGKPRQFA